MQINIVQPTQKQRKKLQQMKNDFEQIKISTKGKVFAQSYILFCISIILFIAVAITIVHIILRFCSSLVIIKLVQNCINYYYNRIHHCTYFKKKKINKTNKCYHVKSNPIKINPKFEFKSSN